MRRIALTLTLLFLSALLLGAAASQGDEEPSFLDALVFEAVPLPPTELSIASVNSSQITLTWKDNSLNETKFQVWRAVWSGDLVWHADLAANATSYTDGGLESSTAYSYCIKACNDSGCTDCTDSKIVSATTSGDNDEDTHVFVNCFIATAVYRDPFHPDVQALRDFRDSYLMRGSSGRAFVRAYYKYSPPVADFIAAHEALRLPLRAVFIPVAAAAKNPGATLLLLAGVMVGVCVGTARRGKKRDQM